MTIGFSDRFATCAEPSFQRLWGRLAYWKTIPFPSVLGILGPSVGLTTLHSACLPAGSGILLVGEGGAGKSVVTRAGAGGFDFIADDRTLRANKGEDSAWGYRAK
jgi:hypothetical protein